MGLDMFLERMPRAESVNKIPYEDREEVCYWRKANAIHNWFVEHVQDGIDDCEYHHEVTKENLIKLLNTCDEVLCNSVLKLDTQTRDYILEDSSKANELLPTTSGFFFGSTEYDKYYLDIVLRTADTIRRILGETDFEKEMIYYSSSW